VLLVEQVDRLSRLTDPDWRKLRAELDTRQVRFVALDLPTSWQLATPGDEFTARMFAALNAMMLDMLAAVARKDYDDRRRRQAQGVAKAKAAGLYRGRPEDTDRNAGIAAMLRSGLSWTTIQRRLAVAGRRLQRPPSGRRSAEPAPDRVLEPPRTARVGSLESLEESAHARFASRCYGHCAGAPVSRVFAGQQSG
jgi:DNA invertase Pin-like site-specific DNA recombinase